MSALFRLRDAGLEVRLESGEVVILGLDRLLPVVAGPLLGLAKDCREGIRAELMASPCPYTDDQLAAFAQSHGHLRCCPATTPPWNWRYREVCATRCKTPCDLQREDAKPEGL